MTTQTLLTDHSVAVYASHDQAEAAVKHLNKAGFDMRNLSIIGQDYQIEEQPIGFLNTGKRMFTWGKYGAFWGTICGLLFGSAFLFLPGIGYVMFAGYIISAIEGALVGGSIGVLGAALTGLGIPEDSVVEYQSALKAGHFLVIAHGFAPDVERAREILAGTAATRVDSYSTRELELSGRLQAK
jgi:hypothetical protein